MLATRYNRDVTKDLCNLSKNNVIYTLVTICMPKTMTLSQCVLQLFCSQRPLWVKYICLEREIIQSNIEECYENLSRSSTR